jgi:AraC-like DNA-binding protein
MGQPGQIYFPNTKSGKTALETCSVVANLEQIRRGLGVTIAQFMVVSFHLEYFVSLLSAVVALVLFFVHRERSLSPKILALYLFCISYIVFIYALASYGDFIQFPHLWRTQVLIGMLNPALAFIYVRSVLEQRYWFRRSDMVLLALPVLLALTFSKFYLQPADLKREVISAALADRALYLQENEGLLPPGFSMTIRILFGNSLTIAQAVLLYRWHVNERPRLPDVPQNRSIFRWLVFFTAVILFSIILSTVQYVFQFFQEKDFYWITSSIVMLSVSSALIYLIFRPNILYGLHGWAMPLPSENTPGEESTELRHIPKRGVISPAYAEKIRAKLESYFENQKPFLRQGYNIANMAAELGVPLYQLSAFINQQYGQSFNEFINGYRVQYVKEVLLKEADADQYTLEALGKKAGFNSRSTFIAAVKKKTGQTPSSLLPGKAMRKEVTSK